MIYNHTKRTVVCQEVERAQTFFARLKGLIGREKLDIGTGMLLSPCNSVHMFFMRFPLDIVFIDKTYRVVGVEVGLAPGRWSKRYSTARYALELPAGQAEAAGLAVCDVLEFVIK